MHLLSCDAPPPRITATSKSWRSCKSLPMILRVRTNTLVAVMMYFSLYDSACYRGLAGIVESQSASQPTLCIGGIPGRTCYRVLMIHQTQNSLLGRSFCSHGIPGALPSLDQPSLCQVQNPHLGLPRALANSGVFAPGYRSGVSQTDCQRVEPGLDPTDDESVRLLTGRREQTPRSRPVSAESPSREF